jgi:hypothetical protein
VLAFFRNLIAQDSDEETKSLESWCRRFSHIFKRIVHSVYDLGALLGPHCCPTPAAKIFSEFGIEK